MTSWAAAAFTASLVAAGASHGSDVWFQGFETDTSGWTSGGSYGTLTRVASGNNGVTSSEGSFHAVAEETASGPYSFFDHSRTAWPGTYSASINVYLDTSWALGSGFDYSVASYKQAGGHLRDFIFHVTKDSSTGNLLVGGSNNSNSAPIENLETKNHFVVPNSGWYTFEHVFREAGDGSLAVDLNLRDTGGSLLFTETRNNAADLIDTVVGGNGYAWFTHITLSGGVAIDSHSLSIAAVPSPAAAGGGLAMLGLTLLRRRR